MSQSKLSQALGAVATTWKLRGFTGLASLLGRKLYWRYTYVRFAVDLDTWQIQPRGGAVTARRATLDELERVRTERPDLPLQFHADRTHGVRDCYLGFVDGQVASVSWVFTHENIVRHMTLRPGEIMLDGAYTLPEFRGRGLLSIVERAILDDARREGVRLAYTHVAVDNRASLRAVWKTGFRPVGLLRWSWIAGVSRARYQDGADTAASAAGLSPGEAAARA